MTDHTPYQRHCKDNQPSLLNDRELTELIWWYFLSPSPEIEGVIIGTMFLSLRNPIHRIAGYYLKHDPWTEDVAQDVFSTIITKFRQPGFTIHTSCMAWVHTVTKNYCLALLRKKCHTVVDIAACSEAHQAQASTYTPDAGIDAAVIQQVMAGVIGENTYRQFILRRHAEGYSYDEIALAWMHETGVKKKVTGKHIRQTASLTRQKIEEPLAKLGYKRKRKKRSP